MLVYLGKVIVLYGLSVLAIRLMGKAALAQLTPHDLTAIVFLATLAISPIATDNFGEAVAGIVIVTLIHILITRLTLFRWLNHYLIGHPTLLIKHGKIIKSNLRRSRYSLVELLASIRTAGYPDVQDVEYAILEPTGEISILPRRDVTPVTPRHLDISIEYQGLPISVIIEGKIQHQNLKLIQKDEKWLMNQLEALGYSQLKSIFYAAVRDTDHSLTVDLGDGKELDFQSG
ncbi:DUF421 domain-containing protein [Brevibacillus sp. H7]|uniref:DUF421 domain-containing protein n=1 Tax=Brevibacillus sp. H7 TaxID=3349138 RepID=UPI003804B4E9